MPSLASFFAFSSALVVKQIPHRTTRNTRSKKPDVEPTPITAVALLAALAEDGGVRRELSTGALDVGVVAGVGAETADDRTGTAPLVEEVVGVLGLNKGFGLAGQGVGSDEGSTNDGAAKVVVFALGPDRGVFSIGELVDSRALCQFLCSISAVRLHSHRSLGSHNHRVAQSLRP